jgi:hypothetical protein
VLSDFEFRDFTAALRHRKPDRTDVCSSEIASDNRSYVGDTPRASRTANSTNIDATVTAR